MNNIPALLDAIVTMESLIVLVIPPAGKFVSGASGFRKCLNISAHIRTACLQRLLVITYIVMSSGCFINSA